MTRREASMAYEGEPQPGLAARVRAGAGLVALAALALFFLQNLQEVEMHFLWFDWTTRMLWALLASAAVGALSVWLVSALRRRGERSAA